MSIVLDLQVGASTDDCICYWYDNSPGNWSVQATSDVQGAGYNGGTYYKIGGGMRFLNVTIPKGSTIVTAYLTLRARSSKSVTTVNSIIQGHDIDDANSFLTVYNYQIRVRTTAVVNWDSIAAWTLDTDYDSPEIKTIIQEIVDREGWESGNALALFWDDHDDLSTHSTGCYREAYSFDDDTTYCAKLHIEYTVKGRSFGYIIG